MNKQILLLISLLMSVFSIQAVELNYQTECIGSYTLQLPSNVEVALYPTETYSKPKSKYPIYFSDGKKAYSSIFNYNDNNLMITFNWLNKKEMLSNYEDSISSYNRVKEKNDKLGKYYHIYIKNDEMVGFAREDGAAITFYSKRIYDFYTSTRYQGEEQNFEFYKQNAEAIITGFTTRDLFEQPNIAGKCLPYAFVAGNNPSTPLNLGVSFRLNDHPDVVISFTENTGSFSDALKFDAKEEMQHFWNYRYDYGNDNISGIKMLGFIKNRSIEMDGRKGVASFVEIQYKDKSPSDYGYYAVVDYYSRNNQSTKDHPWLQLSVVGKASESKGNTPLTRDEIYELAKKIEASIIRRETER